MSYSADWVARHITIPRDDLTQLSGDQYRLDLADFHREMRRLEWGFVDGLWAPQVIEYVLPISVGGTDLAPVTTIINGYTFGFEEFVEPYSVELYGANSNLADVVIVNNVSVRPKNSAGLIIVNGDSVDCVQEFSVSFFEGQAMTLIDEAGQIILISEDVIKSSIDADGKILVHEPLIEVRESCT